MAEKVVSVSGGRASVRAVVPMGEMRGRDAQKRAQEPAPSVRDVIGPMAAIGPSDLFQFEEPGLSVVALKFDTVSVVGDKFVGEQVEDLFPDGQFHGEFARLASVDHEQGTIRADNDPRLSVLVQTGQVEESAPEMRLGHGGAAEERESAVALAIADGGGVVIRISRHDDCLRVGDVDARILVQGHLRVLGHLEAIIADDIQWQLAVAGSEIKAGEFAHGLVR